MLQTVSNSSSTVRGVNVIVISRLSGQEIPPDAHGGATAMLRRSEGTTAAAFSDAAWFGAFLKHLF